MKRTKSISILGISLFLILLLYILLKAIFHFDALIILKNVFFLKYTPHLDGKFNIGLLLLFGVLTSFHCMGMCGGFILSSTIKRNAESNQYSFLQNIKYNLGRVISYTIVGAVIGCLGHIITISGPLKGIIPIIGGCFMIMIALNFLANFKLLKYFSISMPKFIGKKFLKVKNNSSFLLGLFTGLMPCGPLQIMQLYALSTKSIIYGSLSMSLFALGTMPTMLLFGKISTIMSKNLSKMMLKVSGCIVITLAIMMISRGLALSGVSLPGFNNGSNTFATVSSNEQVVETILHSESYEPIIVKKGIKVKWIIKADKNDLNDCNNEILVPEYNICKKLNTGENIIEFTPDQSGDFIYTCWMGMIRSSIKVTD